MTRSFPLLAASQLAATAAALAFAAAAPAQAAPGLSVSPVSLEFDRAGAARAIEISNPGDAPTQVQLRLFAWSAEDGTDHEVTSADIGFSPPMFRLEPGAKQTVRFAAMAGAADGRERAYRLYVDQLPQAAQPGKLQMPVRMVLPFFVEPTGAAPAGAPRAGGPKALRWDAAYDTTRHRVRLTATNASGRRLRLLELTARGPDGKALKIASGLAGYVLAGQIHVWEFDYSGPPGELQVNAGSDQGDVSAQTALQTG